MDPLKALSLEEISAAVRRAFETVQSHTVGAEYGWVCDVYADYAIAQSGPEYWRVPFTVADGMVELAARDQWTRVEKEWVETKALVAVSGGLKALGKGKVGGYLVVFSDEHTPDLTGDFFTKDTDFDFADGDAVTVYYNHGYDDTLKRRKLGKGTLAMRDAGVWMEAQLELRDDYEKAVYKLIEQGKMGLSSGTLPNLVEREPVGKAYHVKSWPLGKDASITPNPAEPRTSVRPLKSFRSETTPEALLEARKGGGAATSRTDLTNGGENEMDENAVKGVVAAALQAEREAREAEAKAKADEQARIDEAVKAERAKWEAEAAKANRMPDYSGAPAVAKFGETRKFDNLDAADQALLVGILNREHNGIPMRRASEAALKALALKAFEDKGTVGDVGRQALKMANPALKSDEIMQQDLSNYGDQWVGVMYSQQLWEAIRQETFVVQNLPAVEVPQGMESIKLPLEGADPVFYKVAEVTDLNSTTGRPDYTVKSSRMGTSQATMTLAKMGARVLWSGELEEDSLIPFVSQLRAQLVRAGAETLEHVIIDGDTETGNAANINDIGGTPAGTEAFLLVNGFRKSPLVTTTANSRSATTLTAADYLETVKLMGLGGRNALQKDRVAFIQDVHTNWKALELPEVKTRDVFSAPTVEGGMLASIWGYRVYTSPFMHWANQDATYGLKANTAGKADLDTASNNTTGAILAVRWDQWLFGWRRRMTIETSRYPESDANQIVCLVRFGLTQRDTEASAISYNVTL